MAAGFTGREADVSRSSANTSRVGRLLVPLRTALPTALAAMLLLQLVAYGRFAARLVADCPLVYTHGYDFKIFYAAVADAHVGGSLYRASALLPFARPQSPNRGSPLSELLFLPLSHLPLPTAFALFQALGFVALAGAMTLVWRAYPWPRSWPLRAVVLLAILTGLPLYRSLVLGNWALPVAALDIGAWWCLRTRRDGLAGVALGLAWALKWQPGLLLVVVLLHRRWGALATAAATLAVSAAGAVAAFGPASLVEFGRQVLASQGGSPSPEDASLWAEWLRVGDGVARLGVRLPAWGGSVPAVLVLLCVVLTVWRCRSLPLDEGFALCLVAGLLAAPLSWTMYHLALLLPLAILAYRGWWLPAAATLTLWQWAVVFAPTDPLLYGSLWTAALLACYVCLWRQPEQAPAANRPLQLEWFAAAS